MRAQIYGLAVCFELCDRNHQNWHTSSFTMRTSHKADVSTGVIMCNRTIWEACPKVGNFGCPRQFARAVLCWYCVKLFFIRTSVGVINPEEASAAFVEAWTRTVENHSSCRKHGGKHVFVGARPRWRRW